jgi:prepilin-type N-terminal cleavage/methylation domain-containing protein
MPAQTQNRRRPPAGGSPPRIGGRVRPAFTLIELLVAMSIMLILAVITIRLVNTTLDSDRLKSGSRELQSYLAGARDRAIYAGQPRGVRFIPDATDPYSVRSFVYIGAPSAFTDGTLVDVTNAQGAINFESSSTLPIWQSLWARGVLTSGTQIQLTQGSGTSLGYLTVAATSFTGNVPQTFAVTSTSGFSLPVNALKYTLQLSPAVLPSEQPRSLPQNISIDLRSSLLPSSWQFPPSASSTYDLLFSPGGTVVGPVASSGRIHFVLADIADTTGEALTSALATPTYNRFQLNGPWLPTTTYGPGNVIVPTPSSYIAFRCTAGGTTGALASQPSWPAQPNQTVTDSGGIVWQSFVKKANTIVSLATATGRVTTHPVDVSTQFNFQYGTPAVTVTGYDSFRFAEIGEVTQ